MDTIGQALFGDDCLSSLGRVRDSLRPSLLRVIQRTRTVIYTNRHRAVERIKKLEQEARQAFDELKAMEKPTKAKIKAAIVKVGRWKADAETLNGDRVDPVKAMEEELHKLLFDMNAKSTSERQTQVTSTATRRLTNKILACLASMEDVAEVLHLYQEFFSSVDSSDDPMTLHEQHPTIPLVFTKEQDGADPGVEQEFNLQPHVLAERLGFQDGQPLLFNHYRHSGGLTAWAQEHAGRFGPDVASKDSDMLPIALHWHQLAAVHSIVRQCFRSHIVDSEDHCTGVLIADEVGLGKTFQATTLLAFLSELTARTQPYPLPPVIKNTPCLGPHEATPDLPHLIIVPGTLLMQWETELKVLFRPHAFNILIYGSGKAFHKAFWAPDGPFHSSKHRLSHRIILASHSALQQDFGTIYYHKANRGELPWKTYKEQPTYGTELANTLYGQRYLCTILDEAHEFRNTGTKHSAALELLNRATLRLVMTATPLQTSTKDLAAMGRLIGLPYFLSRDALTEEKADLANIRRVKAQLAQDYDPLNDDEEDPFKVCNAQIARRMQTQFQGRVIRRTINSLNWDGQSLISLPPCNIVILTMKLLDRELSILGALADKVQESASTSNAMNGIVTKTFYLEYRMGVGFARPNLSDPIPTFSTREEWNEKKSSKFDVCARMCAHILTRDDAPPITSEEGTIIFPPLPPLSPEQAVQRENKILLYQEFPSLGPLLRNVLNLYDVKYLWIDGQTSFEKRASIVSQFRTSSEFRVLIVSSVGSSGLNLSCANFIIFLDQPWSAQDERQIRGRAHRQPQTKPVTCYHLLAEDTADIILSGLAQGKKDMMEAFLDKNNSTTDICAILTGSDPTIVSEHLNQDTRELIEDADDFDEPAEASKTKRTKKGSRAARTATKAPKEPKEPKKARKGRKSKKALSKEMAGSDNEISTNQDIIDTNNPSDSVSAIVNTSPSDPPSQIAHAANPADLTHATNPAAPSNVISTAAHAPMDIDNTHPVNNAAMDIDNTVPVGDMAMDIDNAIPIDDAAMDVDGVGLTDSSFDMASTASDIDMSSYNVTDSSTPSSQIHSPTAPPSTPPPVTASPRAGQRRRIVHSPQSAVPHKRLKLAEMVNYDSSPLQPSPPPSNSPSAPGSLPPSPSLASQAVTPTVPTECTAPTSPGPDSSSQSAVETGLPVDKGKAKEIITTEAPASVTEAVAMTMEAPASVTEAVETTTKTPAAYPFQDHGYDWSSYDVGALDDDNNVDNGENDNPDHDADNGNTNPDPNTDNGSTNPDHDADNGNPNPDRIYPFAPASPAQKASLMIMKIKEAKASAASTSKSKGRLTKKAAMRPNPATASTPTASTSQVTLEDSSAMSTAAPATSGGPLQPPPIRQPLSYKATTFSGSSEPDDLGLPPSTIQSRNPFSTSRKWR